MLLCLFAEETDQIIMAVIQKGFLILIVLSFTAVCIANRHGAEVDDNEFAEFEDLGDEDEFEDGTVELEGEEDHFFDDDEFVDDGEEEEDEELEDEFEEEDGEEDVAIEVLYW